MAEIGLLRLRFDGADCLSFAEQFKCREKQVSRAVSRIASAEREEVKSSVS